MASFLKLASAVVSRINYVLINAGNFILCLLTLAVTVDVIMRYGFDSPLTGVNQISEYGMVWLCFLGVGWVLTKRQHVSLTFLEAYFATRSKRSERRLYLVIDLVCLCYTIPLLWLSIKEFVLDFSDGVVLTGELGGVPAYFPHFCIPLGFLFLSIQLIINVIGSILGVEAE